MIENKKDIHNHFSLRETVVSLISKIVISEFFIVLIHIIINKTIIYFGLHDMNIFAIKIETFELIIFHTANIIIVITIVFKWISNYYVITDKEIFVFNGVIAKKQYSYDINGIQLIKIKQNILGRIFGYGTIIIENPLMKETIIIKNIQTPSHCVNIIKKERDQIRKENYNKEKIIYK